MTDERLGDRLWMAIEALPAGAGIVFRHYSLGPAERHELGKRMAALAHERKLKLAVARDPLLAGQLGADLVHNPSSACGSPISLSVHNEREALAAREAGVDLVFISPVFPTRSHPGAASLGIDRATRLAAMVDCPAIALGGMTFGRFWELGSAFHGWAGIDAWVTEAPSQR
jgi:thiamine-phosphate pyrophosphorylase